MTSAAWRSSEEAVTGRVHCLGCQAVIHQLGRQSCPTPTREKVKFGEANLSYRVYRKVNSNPEIQIYRDSSDREGGITLAGTLMDTGSEMSSVGDLGAFCEKAFTIFRVKDLLSVGG